MTWIGSEPILNVSPSANNRSKAASMSIGSGHEAVGVWMGVKNPLHRQGMLFHVLEDFLRGMGAGAGVSWIEVPDRIDDCRLLGIGVAHHVLDAAGVGFVEAGDLGGIRTARRACALCDHVLPYAASGGSCSMPNSGQ